jgi:serine/threonine-protein kinase
VHRDLKPGNIYVDSDRNIKVLDFGIAKSLDDQPAELARWPQAPMTLKYASPEQIEGGQLTPAADIYSVGVLMYELLTGQHPHAGDAPIGSRLAKAICETDPPLPSSVARSSSLRKTLAGDLDSIVLKAMRRAPTERYGSVRQLSEDIGRFIGGKPILARNSTWPYRASKFVGRYRLGLGLSAALALLFVAFSSFLLFAWRSSLQKKEAELRRQSEELAYEYTRRGEALELIRGLLKATATRRPAEVELTLAEILTNDEKDIEQEVQDPLLQADMIPAVAQTLRNLGLYASEFELLEAIEVKVREKNRRDTESLARALNNIGVLFFQLDNHERAEALYRESLGLKRLSIHDDENIDTTKVASNLATLLSRRGHYEEAQRLYREVIDLRTRRFGSEHSAVATSLRSLGSLHYALGNYEKAEALFANQRLLDNTGDFGVDLEDAVSQRVSLRRKEYREVVGILCASDAMHTASMSDRLPRFAAYDVGESGIYVTAGVLADAKQPESERIRLRLVNRASELLRLTGTRGLLGHYLFQMSKYATDPSMSGDAFVDSQRERPATPTRPLEADP